MVMLAPGKPILIKKTYFEGSDRDGNSYQNAIGSARKVVRLVKELDFKAEL